MLRLVSSLNRQPQFGLNVLVGDAGASNTRLALYDSDTSQFVTDTVKFKTPSTRAEFLTTLQQQLKTFETQLKKQGKTIDKISLAVAGPTNSQTGDVKVVNTNAFATEDGKTFGQALANATQKPTFVLNDADAFAAASLGIYDNAWAITLGSGVGGGLILNNALRLGPGGASTAEVGHMVIDFNGREVPDKNRGAWESYASGSGLLQTAKERLMQVWEAEAIELYGEDHRLSPPLDVLNPLTPEQVVAWSKDPKSPYHSIAQQTMTQWHEHIAMGLANLLNPLTVEHVVIGGGLAREVNLKLLREKLLPLLNYAPDVKEKVQLHQLLGDEHALIGAARFALTSHHSLFRPPVERIKLGEVTGI